MSIGIDHLIQNVTFEHSKMKTSGEMRENGYIILYEMVDPDFWELINFFGKK